MNIASSGLPRTWQWTAGPEPPLIEARQICGVPFEIYRDFWDFFWDIMGI